MSQTLTDRQKRIIYQFEFQKEYSIKEIRDFDMKETMSLSSLKRDLGALLESSHLNMSGEKRNSKYNLTQKGLLHRPFEAETYFKDEICRKNILREYNFDLLNILEKENIFTEEEINTLNKATKTFREKGRGSSEQIVKKELERFVIELSWKSSKIEGNTYTLLDTERLIRQGIESGVNTKEEAIMILNHKKSFSYILDSIKLKKDLVSFRELENIHRLLVEDLGINHGTRKNAVGVTGTKYLPLDVGSQIEEETKKFISILKVKESYFVKGLLSILIISYLQAFEDGNKRTARLFANAMLLQSSLAPLSYRDVDEKLYRESVLIFYEQNSIEAFKKIFIEQYIFSCNTYNLG